MPETADSAPATKDRYDAIVVGAGPNGLSAAVRLAQAGLHTLLVEAREKIGGAASTEALTLPGFSHDVGSAIHPLGLASPFFRTLPLERYGLEWIHPELPLAHPLDGGRAAVLYRSLEKTARCFSTDADSYERLIGPLVRNHQAVLEEVLQPLLHVPRHPGTLLRFGLRAGMPAALLARAMFSSEEARALFAGIAAHQTVSLALPGSSAIGLMLAALGHVVGWPFPQGGAQAISDALAAYLRELGGTIRTGWPVRSLEELPPAEIVLLNLTPRQLLEVAGKRLPGSFQRRLRRYRYGPAAFKVDYALDGPIPWQAEACCRAGTVHLGGPLPEIQTAEQTVWNGRVAKRPFILLAQQSLFDASRAPEGKHTAWAYCHVPKGCTADMTEAIEEQIERFAPGFRNRILARHVLPPAQLEAINANLVGGDINGGTNSLNQLLARPHLSPSPYRLPVRGLYLCSASTPPGGGVHGMCGYHAAETALRDIKMRNQP